MATEMAIPVTSAFPPLATKQQTLLEVRFVPSVDIAGLFDDLVGAGEERGGNLKPERPCRPEIHNQFRPR
jgi:hypothetical protein